jgi:hypothetical protein
MARSLIALLLVLVPASAGAQRSPKEEVLAAGQALFDAMARRDTVALKALLHPTIHLVATLDAGDSVVARTSSRQEFLTQIATSTTVPLERMWNAEVRVSGPIATIWTDYDFHRDREWSHCGIDSFQLVRTSAGWQITGLIYTIVRPASRCKKNPLGPPR